MTSSSLHDRAPAATAIAAEPARSAREPKGLRLWRGPDGRLRGCSDAEPEPRAVRVCRLFPWSRPEAWVSLRDADDEELALVSHPSRLDPESRRAFEHSLAEAGFVMEIEAVLAVDEEIEIRCFSVRTAQGPRRFQTEREEWPRALEGGGLLIRDVAGDLYLVRAPAELDPRSRKLLRAFL